MKKVIALTHFPSPYQVELFNAIAESGHISLNVLYLYAKDMSRSWKVPQLRHEHLWLDDNPQRFQKAESFIERSDLVVFNYYRHKQTRELIEQRALSGKAWCLWGERPGYHGFNKIGALYRRWKLSTLHSSHAPIWGMGKWAVEQYRSEFGEGRLYFNVPYFSDLGRFRGHKDRCKLAARQTVFLYSGSLIRRKGVDLLAKAFSRLADESTSVSLKLVGEGDLRATLERQLARHGDRVEFTGFRQWEELPQLYHTSHVLCVPSRYDGWNLVVPEGLAAGLPIISTDRTGAALELIKPKENGWIVPADDERGLYQAMREAAQLPQADLLACSLAAEKSVAKHTISHGVERFHQAVEATLNAYA